MPFDRRLLTHFEWVLPLVVLAICGLGVVTVYSATHLPGAAGPSPIAIRQLTWLGGGIAVMLAMMTFDYRRLDRWAWAVYLFVLVMILAVPFVGSMGGGARRWLRLGPVAIQPSEFAKLSVVIVMARELAQKPGTALGLPDVAWALALAACPAAIILLQPDLGTAAMVGILALTMAVVGGLRLRWLALMASPVLVAAPVLWNFLRDYQKRRILTFLDPNTDPLGAGYHVIQSKIAVGSGEVWGKGFGQGTQNHLNFLPEQHTDFIFSVFSEEWGLVGATVLLVLYLTLIVRGLIIATRARDRLGVLLVVGVMAIVFWQVVVNIAMTTGMAPVVGIPLPYFSYGGSSLVCLLAGVGLAANVSTRRFLF